MAGRSSYLDVMQQEDRIRRLEDELWLAQQTIIELMPERFRTLLESFHSCSTKNEQEVWRRSTIRKIVEMADAQPPEVMPGYNGRSRRALCPLCGSSSQNVLGVEGFALPDGLLRHLEGSHNSQQCRVFSATWSFARTYWDRA